MRFKFDYTDEIIVMIAETVREAFDILSLITNDKCVTVIEEDSIRCEISIDEFVKQVNIKTIRDR